jgi:hypothetical protein
MLQGEQMPDFTCRFSQPPTAFPHFWEHTVGSGHAPLALRADWQAQMRRCHDDLGFRYVRFHALLSDEMGTLICQNGQLLYSFFNADQIVDFLLSIGMRVQCDSVQCDGQQPLDFLPKVNKSADHQIAHSR